MSPALQVDSLPLSHLGSPHHIYLSTKKLQDVLQGRKHSFKRLNKYQNWSQIGYVCWNYQIVLKKTTNAQKENCYD